MTTGIRGMPTGIRGDNVDPTTFESVLAGLERISGIGAY
jgi:hypothetical protein